MAIITPSHTISEIRGSIGDLTYSRNKYRAYVKARKAPTDTPSSFKNTVRGYWTDAVAEWQAKTETERLTINKFAQQMSSKSRLGSCHPLSGFNYYMRWAMYMQMAGLGLPSSPGALRKLPSFRQLIPRNFTANFSFDYRFWAVQADVIPLIYASKIIDPTIESINSTQMLFITTLATYSGLNVWDFTTQWEDRTGQSSYDAEGYRLFYGIKLFDTTNGNITPMRTFSLIGQP